MKKKEIFTDGENKICVFTGHRGLEADFSKKSLTKIIQNSLKSGVFTYLCGMAVGFDLLAAEILLSMKKKYPQIRLIACIPCLEQDKYFSEEDKTRYRALIEQADEEILLAERYFNGCMQARDRYMAKRADVMIAYCNRETGGAAYTVRYFQKVHPDGEIIFI